MTYTFSEAAIPVFGMQFQLDTDTKKIRFQAMDLEGRISPWSEWYALDGKPKTVDAKELFMKSDIGRG